MDYRITINATRRTAATDTMRARQGSTSPVGRRLFVDMDVARSHAIVSWNGTSSLSRAAPLTATRTKWLLLLTSPTQQATRRRSNAGKLLATNCTW
jgi:hypothetical protein